MSKLDVVTRFYKPFFKWCQLCVENSGDFIEQFFFKDEYDHTIIQRYDQTFLINYKLLLWK